MKELVKKMIDVGCLSISPKNPFSYTSGLRGPLYCDCRLIPSHVELRDMVANGFSEIIDSKKVNYDHIAGVATAGIPHAAFLASLRAESFCYSRSRPKAHGKGKMVEGDVKDGAELLLVEDLINQGSSIQEVVINLRQQGFIINNCLSVVNYETPKSKEILDNLNLECFSLINFGTLTDNAYTLGIIDQEEVELLKKWNKDPENF